jgi:hypothetical protein
VTFLGEMYLRMGQPALAVGQASNEFPSAPQARITI